MTRCITLVPTVFSDLGEAVESFNVAGFRAGKRPIRGAYWG
jgi:hypothetical protein